MRHRNQTRHSRDCIYRSTTDAIAAIDRVDSGESLALESQRAVSPHRGSGMLKSKEENI